MSILKDFHEMLPPVSLNGKDWCAFDKATISKYLMSDGSNCLVDLLTGSSSAPTVTFYFDTEVECYRALLVYYTHHGKQYPYSDLFREAKDKVKSNSETVLNSGKTVTTIQSETMEF